MRRVPPTASVAALPGTLSEPVPAVRRVTPERSATWLARGFADFRAHPGVGLAYGSVFAFIGWFLTFGLVGLDMGSLVLPLASGFMLVAPLAAVGLYEVSRRRERGLSVSLRDAIGAVRRNPQQIADMGLVLLLLFFAWFQLAMILFALFWGGQPPSLTEFFQQILASDRGVPFLAAGTLVGGVIAAIAFALSVVSMPMLLDRDVTAMTAMRASLAAAWANRRNMIGWAATLVTLGFMGMAFFFVGLALTLPVAAHASWHAYRDMVEK